MTEFELACDFTVAAIKIEKIVSPKRYYLHNRVGGRGWEVRPNYHATGRSGTWVRVDDPAMASFIILKLSGQNT